MFKFSQIQFFYINKTSLYFNNLAYICFRFADVVKLVDTLDLGSSAARLGGSSPFIRTLKPQF